MRRLLDGGHRVELASLTRGSPHAEAVALVGLLGDLRKSWVEGRVAGGALREALTTLKAGKVHRATRPRMVSDGGRVRSAGGSLTQKRPCCWRPWPSTGERQGS